MYLLFSFVLCRKMREKKFMKNSSNQHYCQTRVADGTSPFLSMVTATLTLMGLHPFFQKEERTNSK